ncbi:MULTISPECIES: NAD(P)H-binding protein [unclassified Paenibacillus]|uniref:NAD(P)H-binding protein n=1 Tax=unclassified Paenibacillus TaxID=185978 RepID=UPI00363669BC
MGAAERCVVDSGLDWTICYFGALTDDPASGRYGISTSLATPGKLSIPRAVVADFLLSAATGGAYIRQRVVLSGPGKATGNP